MAVKVGINGFGRIGRQVLRAAVTEKEFSDIEVVSINCSYDIDYMAYMFKFDSVHGRVDAEISTDDGDLVVNGKRINVTAERDPNNIDWSATGTEVVVESTGVFLTTENCQPHINNGAKKVVQSAPAKDSETPMFVYGVNHALYNGQAIVSAASCTTNGLAPVAKVMQDNFGIKRGLMTTIHASTASQQVVDSTSKKDWRGGRSVYDNIIPSSTGAAKAVGRVIPELNKKLTGMAMRVPSSDVSVVDLTIELDKETTYDAISQAMKEASETSLQNVLGYTDEKVVSTDFRTSSFASVFDAGAGIMLDSTFVKLVAWYDNEFGYTCNLMRLVQHVSK